MKTKQGTLSRQAIARLASSTLGKSKKVDDLTIEELNQQVALCQGWKPVTNTQTSYIVWSCDIEYGVEEYWRSYTPCTDAQQAFEIIEREKIYTIYRDYFSGEFQWDANGFKYATDCVSFGETALIAAMRCFVKSIKGEEVEL